MPYLLDACQSVGQMPRVDELGCDFLATTGRKFLRGPRGTGFLYVRGEWAERLHPAAVDLGGAAWTELESYTLRTARAASRRGRPLTRGLGLGSAIRYALDLGLDAIWARVASLAARLRAGLGELGAVELHDLGETRCGIVSFTVAGHGPESVKAGLAARGFHVELSFMDDTRLDLEARGLTSLERASVHYYNSEDEVDRLVAAVADLGGD